MVPHALPKEPAHILHCSIKSLYLIRSRPDSGKSPILSPLCNSIAFQVILMVFFVLLEELIASINMYLLSYDLRVTQGKFEILLT